jgi:hypothetical protein
LRFFFLLTYVVRWFPLLVHHIRAGFNWPYQDVLRHSFLPALSLSSSAGRSGFDDEAACAKSMLKVRSYAQSVASEGGLCRAT